MAEDRIDTRALRRIFLGDERPALFSGPRALVVRERLDVPPGVAKERRNRPERRERLPAPRCR
jgi:hypothetical protein